MHHLSGLFRRVVPIIVLIAIVSSSAQTVVSFAESVSERSPSTWIVKWKREPHPDFWRESEIVEREPEFAAFVVRPKAGVDPNKWMNRWMGESDIEYLRLNHKVRLLAAPNDPYYPYQDYLKQIHAPQAWEFVKESPSVVIALIDTGVDLNHPDLKDNLVGGVNLITPNAPPQDDHGHGTNVAGVVAAIGDNLTGVSGITWKARIMPIKALEADGQGDENKLGEGIRYAVDHGAKIIVMSVGLHRYSPFLQEVADYAEKKGVLLISATGNEGRQVKYPAAYPTVLAIGGVDPDNRVMLESNFGPEVDLVAPWEVYTTALGGDYEYNQGTSMAAPQAAGVAALVWSKYPEMKPYEVRNLLQQTAQDVEAKGWDALSGYGLLRPDKALGEPYRVDMYEPNDTKDNAKLLPMDAMIYGELGSGSDTDWFFIDPDYKGNVRLTMTDASGAQNRLPKVNAAFYAGDGAKGTEYADILRNPPVIPVQAGKSRLAIRYADPETASSLRYKLKTAFEIYKDAFEDNDSQYKAYTIPQGQPSLKGTFHRLNDQDWFSINVEKSGSLQLSVIPDSVRMDVAVMIQKTGEKPVLMDQNAEGGRETISAFDVMPGRYYILISNVISDDAYPVPGEYELQLQIAPKLFDPNEPNDKAYQATSTVMKTEYRGLIDKSTDVDWFAFALQSDSYVRLRLRDIPDDRLMLMTLYDAKQTQVSLKINSQGETKLEMALALKKGTYTVKLGANKPFTNRLYRFDVQADALIAGFRDIKGHWAESAIARMAKEGYANGYGDFTFRPDRSITRAEAVVMLVKAFGFSGGSRVSFSDMKSDHWAAGAIQAAVKAGMISGYSDGTFGPDRPINRAEMAAMVARGLGMKDTAASIAPFADVKRDYWAAGWMQKLRRENLISGYSDGTFRPDKQTGRAEMASLAVRIIEHK